MNKSFMSYLVKKTDTIFVKGHNVLESYIIFSFPYSPNL